MGKENIVIPDKLYFKIGEVSDLTGIKPYVLRYWETEFPISPKKSRTGQRLYRKEDIEKILEIRRLLYDEGFTIAGARRHLAGGTVEEEATPETAVQPKVDMQAMANIRDRLVALKKDIQQLKELSG